MKRQSWEIFVRHSLYQVLDTNADGDADMNTDKWVIRIPVKIKQKIIFWLTHPPSMVQLMQRVRGCLEPLGWCRPPGVDRRQTGQVVTQANQEFHTLQTPNQSDTLLTSIWSKVCNYSSVLNLQNGSFLKLNKLQISNWGLNVPYCINWLQTDNK